jgi:hypothetical protein
MVTSNKHNLTSIYYLILSVLIKIAKNRGGVGNITIVMEVDLGKMIFNEICYLVKM